MFLTLVLSLLSFILFLSLHLYVFHNVSVKRRFRTILLIAVFSLLVYSVFYWLLVDNEFREASLEKPAALLSVLFSYIFFAYFYFTHIVLVNRSITTRFMVEIDASKNKHLRIGEIKSNFNMEKKLQTELEDMQVVGRIVREGEYFKNTAKGSQHARIVRFCRKYLNLDKSS